MKLSEWIATDGGPLVIIPSSKLLVWSGTYKSISNPKQELEEALDFLDPLEADYGKACSVEDYIGLKNLQDEQVVVLGDEPMVTALLKSDYSNIYLARWEYGESEEYVENRLNEKVLEMDFEWTYNSTVKFSSDKIHIFDSAYEGRALQDDKSIGQLAVPINSGLYDIFSSIYEIADKMKIILHWLKLKK